MVVVQIEIPEELWERLQQTGHPLGEVVVEALERRLEETPELAKREPYREEIIRRLREAKV